MPSVTTGYEHITIGKDNVPIITGTTMKVVELVIEKIAYGWSPEEFHFQHPQLALAQIHSLHKKIMQPVYPILRYLIGPLLCNGYCSPLMMT